jgi:hypothetical protein
MADSHKLTLLCLGVKLKVLSDAAENYNAVLAENRKMFNELQDLKGATYYLSWLYYLGFEYIFLASNLNFLVQETSGCTVG